MTDTTDIKALRELALNANMAITRLSASGEDCLYAIGEDPQIDKDVELSNQFHKAFNPIVVIYLLDQLEAERQRADRYHFVAMSALEAQAEISEQLGISEDECDGSPEQIHEKIEMLQTAIAALKGDQVPVGWFTDDKEVDKSATTYSEEVATRWRAKGWPVGELFTAPQKPVVLPEADHETEDGYKYYRKETVLAAIKAAGGIVKDGE